tara:strand:+ start:693 stop:944 length:252 start_codon:yes stop_codon:yes gene_type:complete
MTTIDVSKMFAEKVKKMNKQKEEKPIVKLSGTDGNAMAVLAKATRAARKAGWSEDKMNEVLDEATGGDYDNVLLTVFKYFEVE